MKIPFCFEKVYDSALSARAGIAIYRSKVIGGWVVVHYFELSNTQMTSIFVPDPNHSWEINDKVYTNEECLRTDGQFDR